MAGPHVLITGVGSGIGRATALHLAGRGFTVTGAVRDPADGDGLQAQAAAAGVAVEPVVLELTDPEACEEVAGRRPWFGLVNNAGYFNAGLVEDVARSDARRQLETMVLAPLHLAQVVLPAMRAQGQGRIVNVSSGIVHLAAAGTGWYQASKQALSAASDALRAEVAGDGIEVVLIEPGGINSEIWSKAERDLMERRGGSARPQGYERALRLLRALDGRMHPPTLVAEAIGDALTARRPRTRYRVGREVALMRATRYLLPDRLRDRALRTLLGM
ncbi:SDR family NAD(P)-dependent oxidoreductase [Egicoccus halophilus]|uniref:Short-chain dehydrogenase n=1 Tax=Egicoccus halophilus TaxID=1670830 RepID=A0A8J3AFB8_9ACTN|nr:SDR family NAD(P)-dependent oxidoreductase [Egicoccus halophilus]GGI07195.1 short-chain dehydrogenase [Egicoccus halophilus]